MHRTIQILILIFKNMDSVLYNFGSPEAPSPVPHIEQNHRFIDNRARKSIRRLKLREKKGWVCCVRSQSAVLEAVFQTQTFIPLCALLQPACPISVVDKISWLLIIRVNFVYTTWVGSLISLTPLTSDLLLELHYTLV